jgi:hypothetical protein
MTNLHGATEFERAVIEHIIEKDAPKYKKHLRYLSVDRRENTDVGVYVYFNYSDTSILCSDENRTAGQSLYAEIEGLQWGAGFMLYIDDGQITMLESFCHGAESWPAQIRKFKLKDL